MNIEVRFQGGLTANQEAAFESAAERWSQLISADVPNVIVDGVEIDDVLINATGVRIDGPAGTLGRAGPLLWRPDTLIPALGVMEFDVGDLDRMQVDGSLEMVIIHEMGHVLGMGTLWEEMGLLQGAGTANPVFTGSNAAREFASLIGSDTPTPVPVENEDGVGTRDGHWRESVFGNELMTGFLDTGANPVSLMTLAALQDMGYQVNFDAADAFTLPSFRELAMIGVFARVHDTGCLMAGAQRRGAEPAALPESALLARA